MGDGPPAIGEFSWHELATTAAPNVAFGFYAALFDWDLVAEHDMGPMGMYLVFGRNGRQLGGMFEFISKRGRGTTVSVRVPFRPVSTPS